METAENKQEAIGMQGSEQAETPKKRGRKKKSELDSSKTSTPTKSTPSPENNKKKSAQYPQSDTQLNNSDNSSTLIDTNITNTPDSIGNAIYADNTDISDTLLDTAVNPNLKDTDISHTYSDPVLPKQTRNTRTAKKVNRVSFATHDGHALTSQEATFIDRYIETGNGTQSVIDAGYKTNHPAQYAQQLLNKLYINSEIKYRLECAKTEAIASATEIMQYFTDVMRGKIKDQFDMEASLSERTKAAQELAKRQIDIPNRLAGNDEPTLTIKLDFGQNDDSEPMKTVEPVKPNIQLDGITD